jgi:hypothetical protein
VHHSDDLDGIVANPVQDSIRMLKHFADLFTRDIRARPDLTVERTRSVRCAQTIFATTRRA